MNETTPYVITIDGPGGSGKGSLALRLAKALNFHILDSGAIYRLAALKALRAGVDLGQQEAVVEVLQDMQIHFESGEELSIPFLDGEEVADQVRLESTGDAASIIAQYADV